MAVDFIERDSFPGQRPGIEGMKDVIAMFRSAFPDLEWRVEESVAEGDTVASRFTWQGTHSGPFLGVPATGKYIRVSGIVFDRVVNGKMVESQILNDTVSLLTQLGVINQPG